MNIFKYRSFNNFVRMFTIHCLLVTVLVASAFAQTQQQAASPLAGFIPLILIFVVFYFLLILPQKRRDKEHKKTINALKKNDYVLTSSGIYGTVINVKPEIVELKIDENTKVQILKTAISQVITKSNEPAEHT